MTGPNVLKRPAGFLRWGRPQLRSDRANRPTPRRRRPRKGQRLAAPRADRRAPRFAREGGNGAHVGTCPRSLMPATGYVMESVRPGRPGRSADACILGTSADRRDRVPERPGASRCRTGDRADCRRRSTGWGATHDSRSRDSGGKRWRTVRRSRPCAENPPCHLPCPGLKVPRPAAPRWRPVRPAIRLRAGRRPGDAP